MIRRIQTVSVTPPGGSATAILTNLSWEPFGPPITYTFAQGSQTLTKTFDQNYWMTDVSGNALNLHFCRDAQSNITSLVPNASAYTGTKIEQYVYDNLYRLTHVQDGTGADLQDFTYNLTGDRLTKTLDPAPTQTYTYTPSTHRLDGVGANARILDANGNTTETTGGTTLDYTFDNRNRMTAVSRNSTPITSYDFNAREQRVYKSTTYPASDTRWFTFTEGGTMLGEYTTTSAQEYVWADDTPIAILGITGQSLTPGDSIFADGFEAPPIVAINYVHADQINSPRVVTSPSGTSLWNWSWQTNPFGETQPTGTFTLNLRAAGQCYDTESGLGYNYYRDYEAQTGRYIESDPTGLKGGISTYTYVASNPFNFVDLLGLVGIVQGCGRDPGITLCDGKGGFEVRVCHQGCSSICIFLHEVQHAQDYSTNYPNACRYSTGKPVEEGAWNFPGFTEAGDYFGYKSECNAHRRGRSCAEFILNNSPYLSCSCKKDLQNQKKNDDYRINEYYQCAAHGW